MLEPWQALATLYRDDWFFYPGGKDWRAHLLASQFTVCPSGFGQVTAFRSVDQTITSFDLILDRLEVKLLDRHMVCAWLTVALKTRICRQSLVPQHTTATTPAALAPE